MDHTEFEAFFYRKRWPDGYECPRCAHRSFYTVSTRRLPLYQCRLCKHQTTVTAGTVMDRSRTPLAKWAAAIDFLTSTGGVNAVRLAAEIAVSHKTAWLMLRSFRRAIRVVEAGRTLGGDVHAGLQVLGPYSTYFPYRHYKNERVIFISGAMNVNDQPTAIGLTLVPQQYLTPGRKELTTEGVSMLSQQHDTTLLSHFRMCSSPLRKEFKAAARWIKDLFHGLSSASLPACLDEYSFRWNTAAEGLSLREQWYKLCFTVHSSIRRELAASTY